MLTKEAVYRDYVVNGMSDREIAAANGVGRSAVTHFRKYHGISTRDMTGLIGERLTRIKLFSQGFMVKDMNETVSKSHPFDLMINGSIRAEVKSAKPYKGFWRFTLTSRADIGISDRNEDYITLRNGRLRKDFTKTCDVVLLCGIRNKSFKIFVVPPSVIPLSQNTIAIPITGGRKWSEWESRWDIIGR